MRRSRPMVSRTSQWSLFASSVASQASTAAASPSVLMSQVPISSSLVRICRIASSSSRAICSGHQLDAGLDDRLRRLRLRGARRLDGEGGGALRAVDLDGDETVAQRVGFHRALQRGQLHALGIRRPVALRGQRQRALLHLLREDLRLGDVVDQPPVLGLLPAHAFGGGAEDVGQVVPHVALVGHAGQAAGARQHAEQRHLGQAHRRRAVVDQDDLVAGQRHLVAAAGAGAVHRGQELQAAVLRRVLEPVARLVGELAEVHLPRVARDAEHEDVGARAEHLVLQAGDDHRAHLGVLEADPVHARRSTRCPRPGRSC